ncbi:T9SS type A sorting domain-containing protein [Aequorivita viscosa]|nr:T9SS type A sorting domain-containing protein [Aequorivita viscosa]
MKRTFIFITFLLVTFLQNSYAQLTYEANEEYGQIYDVLFDATIEGTLYARTVGNHIIKSEDDGDNWTVLYSDPMEEYAIVRNMRLINNNENLSFIVRAEGTAYNKVVIIDRNDGSVIKEYNVPNGFESDILIQSYNIYEADNNIALLHTTYTLGNGFTNEVFKTTDGGVTWFSIYFSPVHGDVAINNVAISPINPEHFFLMRGGGPGRDMGGLFVSLDGGSTWDEKLPGNTYSAIAFNPTDSNDILLGTFYGYGSHREGLYRSLDGGDTWAEVSINYTSMSNDHINTIQFNPQNTDNIVVLEENEIITTNDNGLTWNNQVYTDVDPAEYYYGLSVSFNPFHTDDLIIAADFYPFRSADGGVTLQKLNSPMVNSTGRIDAYAGDTESHLYYGLRNGFMHRDLAANTETGHRMRELNNTFGSTTFPHADKVVAGRIFNSGRFGMDSVLEMSLDHGESYSAIYTTMMFINIYAMATDPINTNIVWFSFGEALYKFDVTDPTAPVFEEIALPSGALLYGIIIDPTDSDRITITQGVNVYISNDGGTSWEDPSSGLEILVDRDDMIFNASVNPLNSDQYLISTTQGIFASADKGATWTQIFDEQVDRAYYSSQNEDQIVAITHYSDGWLYPKADARIVYSFDNGANWEEISAEALGYLNTASSTVQFVDDRADVYFGTFDLGLVKYSIDLFVLGTTTNETASEIAIFPNPANDSFSVNASNKNVEGVTIYNVTGQLVMATTSQLDNIDISQLASGMHLVKINTDEGIYFKRLLKK